MDTFFANRRLPRFDRRLLAQDDGDDDLDLESGYGDGSSGSKNQMQVRGNQARCQTDDRQMGDTLTSSYI